MRESQQCPKCFKHIFFFINITQKIVTFAHCLFVIRTLFIEKSQQPKLDSGFAIENIFIEFIIDKKGTILKNSTALLCKLTCYSALSDLQNAIYRTN